MDSIGKNTLLIEELKKCKLCRLFWSDEISSQLKEPIILDYKPMGEMGVYFKSFEFSLSYSGNKPELSGLKAFISLEITSNYAEYDIQKAIAGKDCFHNLKIKLIKENAPYLAYHYILWSNEDAEYSGNETAIKLILNN